MWNSMYVDDKNNIYARQSLAHMARFRGNWRKLKPTCRQPCTSTRKMKPSCRKWGCWQWTGASVKKIKACWTKPKTFCLRRVEVAPGNPKTIVALAVLEGRMGETDAARRRLHNLLAQVNNLHARHAYAMTYDLTTQRRERKRRIDETQH